MERNQFFYKRTMLVDSKVEGEPKEEVVFMDSFNVNKVVRSMQFPTETVVMLDDGHEQTEVVPVQGKNNKVQNERFRVWNFSEIHLKDPEEIARFRAVTEIG